MKNKIQTNIDNTENIYKCEKHFKKEKVGVQSHIAK